MIPWSKSLNDIVDDYGHSIAFVLTSLSHESGSPQRFVEDERHPVPRKKIQIRMASDFFIVCCRLMV